MLWALAGIGMTYGLYFLYEMMSERCPKCQHKQIDVNEIVCCNKCGYFYPSEK
jgi:hypothetical protein